MYNNNNNATQITDIITLQFTRKLHVLTRRNVVELMHGSWLFLMEVFCLVQVLHHPGIV